MRETPEEVVETIYLLTAEKLPDDLALEAGVEFDSHYDDGFTYVVHTIDPDAAFAAIGKAGYEVALRSEVFKSKAWVKGPAAANTLVLRLPLDPKQESTVLAAIGQLMEGKPAMLRQADEEMVESWLSDPDKIVVWKETE